ncbi:MAG: hypothetical protein MR874_10535 [Coriobacteriaceae bacterium]|nr:hypothetical protein [Coriobacteriaceae bacterium]MCI6845172.1 hypothetical protein [Coriobacteriaceae bacterium]
MDPNCLPVVLPAGWVRSGAGRIELPDQCAIGGRDLGGWSLVVDPERTDGLTLAERATSGRLPRLAVTGLARRSVGRESALLRDEDVLGAAWDVDEARAADGEPPAAPEATEARGDGAPLALATLRELVLSRLGAGR